MLDQPVVGVVSPTGLHRTTLVGRKGSKPRSSVGSFICQEHDAVDVTYLEACQCFLLSLEPDLVNRWSKAAGEETSGVLAVFGESLVDICTVLS